jgi:DNA-binding NtrC family response regulator
LIKLKTLIVTTVVHVSEPGLGSYLLRDYSAGGGDSVSSDKRDAVGLGFLERPSVLVVDDEHLIADSVTEILTRNGYDAIARYSGESALECIEQKCPDILVSDVFMPDCNGIELAISVRSQCPGTRVLLFSGNAATSGLVMKASDEGYFFELLAKPVHPAELLKVLKS